VTSKHEDKNLNKSFATTASGVFNLHFLTVHSFAVIDEVFRCIKLPFHSFKIISLLNSVVIIGEKYSEIFFIEFILKFIVTNSWSFRKNEKYNIFK